MSSASFRLMERPRAMQVLEKKSSITYILFSVSNEKYIFNINELSKWGLECLLFSNKAVKFKGLSRCSEANKDAYIITLESVQDSYNQTYGEKFKATISSF